MFQNGETDVKRIFKKSDGIIITYILLLRTLSLLYISTQSNAIVSYSSSLPDGAEMMGTWTARKVEVGADAAAGDNFRSVEDGGFSRLAEDNVFSRSAEASGARTTRRSIRASTRSNTAVE